MNRKVTPITKPYRIHLQVDNKPLVKLPKLAWTVIVENERKSFTLYTASTEWPAMHLWRTQCEGSPIVKIYSYESRV